MIQLTSLQFAKHFRDIINKSTDERFCFILGSGASRQSGIPTGGELADKWLKELKEDYWSSDMDKWMEEKKINASKPGEHYSEIFKKRFEVHPQEGYDELNRLMERVVPSFGYSVLAQTLETKNNVVITTNFDNLIEEALFSFSLKRPLVCGHEYLASYATLSDTRPLIVKIHRDRQLAPLNTSEEISKIKAEWINVLNNIFSQCIPVFIGYGGNDGSLMNYLDEISSFKNLFWCDLNYETLKNETKSFIKTKNGKFVRIESFDELLFDLFSTLNFSALDKNLVETASKRAADYTESIKKIQSIKSKSPIEEDQKNVKDLNEKLKDNWLSYYWDAENAKTVEEKEKIYVEGINKFSNQVDLILCYSQFLKREKKDYVTANKMFLEGLKIDPDNANLNGDYAIFLSGIQRDNDIADTYYLKSVQSNPTSCRLNCNYAVFLRGARQDHNKAEIYYLRALELDPNDANTNTNYANFLDDVRHDKEKAERYYLKSLIIDSENANINGNYARFLITEGRKEESAKYLKKAFSNCDHEILRSELIYYQLATDQDQFKDNKPKIQELVKNGVRSLYWNFEGIIEQAKKENHPDIAFLQLTANILSQDIPVPENYYD